MFYYYLYDLLHRDCAIDMALLYKQLRPRGHFVEQKLSLSCSFRCDQIYNNCYNVFGHTLLRYLSQTLMFNKPTSASEVGLLNIKSYLSSTTKCDKIISVTIMHLVTPKAGAKHELSFNEPASNELKA